MSESATDLPQLTARQQRFVERLLAGDSGQDAYMAAFRSKSTHAAVRRASQLRRKPEIEAWLAAAREAHLQTATVTLNGWVREMDRLAHAAERAGNWAAAVHARTHIAKATGVYVERSEVDVRVSAPRDLLTEIGDVLGPQAALDAARRLGLPAPGRVLEHDPGDESGENA